MAVFTKLTPRTSGEGGAAEIWVNLDLAVSLTRVGDRTLIDFTAPRHTFVPVAVSGDTAPRRIEVVETPEQVIEIQRTGWTAAGR
jgi:hypothetical protein